MNFSAIDSFLKSKLKNKSIIQIPQSHLLLLFRLLQPSLSKEILCL
ncbi:hypothetical protein CPter91_5492 [Collimonas pratensis]|uniref:Uncharacterized protein n=1 Tax=Collimonas pratensis TaxID=279113 RepID=A0A127QD67_9BURK|nr:hypothetical protein CPter91_5492 [Collimonas pratensis]